MKTSGQDISSVCIQRCFDEGLEIIKDAVVYPQNMWVNTIQSLLLTGKSKYYRKWERNYEEVIKVNDRAVDILRFHSNIGNLVDLSNVLGGLHISCLLRQLRNHTGDREDALCIVSDAVKLFEVSNK